MIFLNFFLVLIIVQSLSIIVNVEFLLVLSGIFTSALEDTETKPVSNSQSLTDVPKVTSTELAATSAVTSGSASQGSNLSLKFQMEEPEIILLADAKHKNTDALILKVITRTVVKSFWLFHFTSFSFFCRTRVVFVRFGLQSVITVGCQIVNSL